MLSIFGFLRKKIIIALNASISPESERSTHQLNESTHINTVNTLSENFLKIRSNVFQNIYAFCQILSQNCY